MPSNQKQIDTHTFTEGISTTIASELIPANTARYILNCNILSQGAGNVGIVTNVKGNKEISFSLPAGENKCIGTAVTEENNKFYFFVWNENHNDGIYQFDGLTKTITTVLLNLEDTGGFDLLRLSKDYLILHANIVRNNLLYWVDGLNNARKTNISKLFDKTDTGYGTTILESFINAYKRTSDYAPTVEYFSDTTKPFNRIYGTLRRFASRYIYDDGEKSNWSDFSNIALPDKEPYTGINIVPIDNNGLKITVETGDRTVYYIEIGMQSTSGELNDEGILNWVLITTIDKKRLQISDSSQYTYNFYNDSVYPVTEYDKIIRPYSFLPKTPLCQAVVKNAIVYSNFPEGFPFVDISMVATVDYEDLYIEDGTENKFNVPALTSMQVPNQSDYVSSHETAIFYDGSDKFISQSESPIRFNILTITVGSDVKSGNKFQVFINNGGSDNFSFAVTASLSDNADTISNKIKQQLINTQRVYKRSGNDSPISADIYNNTTDGDGNITFSFVWRSARNQGYANISSTVNPVQYNTLKDTGESKRNIKLGSTVKIGIMYEDFDGRKSLTYTVDALIIGIKTINELVLVDGKNGFQSPKITIQINHIPPIWAKFYQIVRSGDLTYGDYIQLLIQTVVEDTSGTNQYLDLVVGSLFTYQKIHPNTSLNYEFVKGDRLRLQYKVDINTDTVTYYPFFETEIIDYNTSITDRIRTNITTNGSDIVTVKDATVNNIGKFILIEGSEREILDAPSITTYQLNASIGDSTAKTYLFYDLADRRGTVRIRKPSIDIADYSVVELYKPSSSTAALLDEQFLEFQKKFPIIGAGTDLRYHGGNKQNQTASLPALVEITEGTAYVRNRELPVNNTYPGTQVIIKTIEDPSFSDFYPSLINDNGRTNVEDTGTGEVHFGSRMRFSNNYIEDTKINGLNDFDNLDREDYNDKYGDIKRTVFDTNNIFTLKELKSAYVTVNSKITQDDAGTALRVGTNQILNPIQYFAWEGGIGNNPESYCSNGTQKYLVSANSGVIIRIGGNGEEPISKTYQLDNEVRSLLKNASANNAKIFTQVDREMGVLVVAIEGYNEYVYFDGFNGWILENDALPINTAFELVSSPNHGSIVFTNASQWTYVPATDYVGADTFTYRAFINGVWSSPIPICLIINAIPDRQKTWIQDETSSFCILVDDIRNGDKGWSQLKEIYLDDSSNTGNFKQNVITDPDYVPPIVDTITCTLPFYNIEKTQNFVKNDCSVDSTGTSVPYTVLANTYFSYIDQSTADAMAQADIDANGQNHANSVGECIFNPFVTINYKTVYGSNPFTWNALTLYKNEVETTRIEFETVTTQSLPSTYRIGDTIKVQQYHYTTIFPWAPSSKANLTVLRNNNTSLYNADNSDPDVLGLNVLEYTIPTGTTSIDIVSTGSSTAIGYLTRSLVSNNFLTSVGLFNVKLYDPTNGLFIINVDPDINTQTYPFNHIIDSNLLTIQIQNKSSFAISYTIIGGGGSYNTNGNISVGSILTLNDLPKDSITVDINTATTPPEPPDPPENDSPIIAQFGVRVEGSPATIDNTFRDEAAARSLKGSSEPSRSLWFSGTLGNGTVLYRDSGMTQLAFCYSYYIPATDMIFIINGDGCSGTVGNNGLPSGSISDLQSY